MSLNPALEDLHFCPRCGKPPTITYPAQHHLRHCGYAAFYNPKPVACAIPQTADNELILMRRGFEPRRGHWSMPGGFVDLGESVAGRRDPRSAGGTEPSRSRSPT